MTPSIVEALKKWAEIAPKDQQAEPRDGEPTLQEASVGNPISHGQITDLWKNLRDNGDKDCGLESLLRGSTVYVPPPPPKPEPSSEYKALMARLRRDEEERAYERMINPPVLTESFARRYPGASSMAHAFAEVNRPTSKADMGDDDVTYNDVHRQLMLILNFVLSILGVAGTLWVLARWWPTPARLFLTMGGSIAVGIAEVGLYSGYIWHLGQAKKKDVKFKEVKEVVQTWVVGPDQPAEKSSTGEPISIDSGSLKNSNLRRRKKEEP